MEIHPQSPLSLLSELLIPICPEEADTSEMYVLSSFTQKLLDYGWFLDPVGQVYFYKSLMENRDTLLYQVSKNSRLELVGNGHNFKFIKEDLCLSFPRNFYNSNYIFELLNSLIHFDIYQSRFSPQLYVNIIESYDYDVKVISISDTKIVCKLNDRINLLVKVSSNLFEVVIKDENSRLKLLHPKVWCETENYWVLVDQIINNL